MRLGLLALALIGMTGLAASGCSPTAPCIEERRVIDVLYTEPGKTIGELGLLAAGDRGFNCDSYEPLRNAFGGQIGTRFTCTRCQ